jgi:hypothetical protein
MRRSIGFVQTARSRRFTRNTASHCCRHASVSEAPASRSVGGARLRFQQACA